MPPTTAKQIDFLMSGLGDKSGRILAGGKVFAFDAGTDKPRDTWIDADQNTLSPNPIILDSRGTAIAFAFGDYKFVIKDSNDVVINTRDFEFYGSQGVGEFFIADENGPGGPGFPAPGELVTGDGTDLGGGSGGGGSGAQVTDDGSVNGPAIACGDSVPCHCGCCQPSKYRVTLGGQTGLFADFNGVWIVQRAGGKIGLYHKITPAGLITLDLSGITCTSLTIIAGDLTDTATIGSSSICAASGSVGALTWAICPLGTAPTLNPIEVTFAGVLPCAGCLSNTDVNPTKSYNNIVVGINGTFSLPLGGCAWSLSKPKEDVSISMTEFTTASDCTGASSVRNLSLTITVAIIGGNTVRVIASGGILSPAFGGGATYFFGETPLLSGEAQCIDNLGINNDVACGEVEPVTTLVAFASGGLANINWEP